jgi:hypothetical protein
MKRQSSGEQTGTAAKKGGKELLADRRLSPRIAGFSQRGRNILFIVVV